MGCCARRPADINSIGLPIGRGFLYLVAIIDRASRAAPAWRLSNSMDVSFCISALEEALAWFGKPDIFNTDQGGQFTSAAFTGALLAVGIKVSMDGRGRWLNNVFIERLWRSLNHKATPMVMRRGLGSPPGWHSTTPGGLTRRWETGRQWRSGVPASPTISGRGLWI